MSQVTHLASGPITRSGDTVSIELHQPLDSPSFVMVVWPQKSSVTAATPKALAALAAAMVRTLAEAQTTCREDQGQPVRRLLTQTETLPLSGGSLLVSAPQVYAADVE
jgi:hypothetical protein